MPIKITLHAEIILPDYWGTKDDLDDIALQPDGSYDLGAFAAFLNEDWTSVLEPLFVDGGPMRGLLKAVEWVKT